MNRKIITLSTLFMMFLVACGGTSSASSSETTSEESSATSSSEVVTSSEESSSEEVNDWGIINGDFEDTTDDFTHLSSGWNQWVGSPEADGIVAAAEYQTEDSNSYGAMVIESITDSSQWWHAQLRQNGVNLYGSGSYVLNFKVRAAAARTIRVQIQGGGLTSKPTALNELAVEVSTTWETKQINFIAPSDAVNAELQFGFGPDSYLPNDLSQYARLYDEVHLDDVSISLGEPLPNQAPTISGGDLLVTAGESVLIKSGLTVRDDYDRDLALADVIAVDITNGTKLNAETPVAGIYTFLYTLRDSEGLVGSHQRKIYVTNPNQLMNNTEFKTWGNNGMPLGWDKWNEDNNGGQRVTAGVMPHNLSEALLGNLINGDFETAGENFEDHRGWNVWQGDAVADGIVGSMGVTGGVGIYTTESVTEATQFWHAQLRQENVRLPKGNFTLEFKAKADEARTIRVALAGGGIVATGRAINEVPVVLTTTLETYTIDFTAEAHSYGSLLQFFFGPDSFLPTEGDLGDLNALYGRNTSTVYIDDVTFRYEDAESPVATMIPTLAVDLWRIVEDGWPWENQVKYANLAFYQGTYQLNFSAYAEDARPVILALEGNGGVDQASYYRTVELTQLPQRFSYDVTFDADSTNASRNIQFFMGSYAKYESDFSAWWSGLDPVDATDNVLTTIYYFDFSFDLVA